MNGQTHERMWDGRDFATFYNGDHIGFLHAVQATLLVSAILAFQTRCQRFELYCFMFKRKLAALRVETKDKSYLQMKGEFAWDMIFFSEWMCSCCRVSIMCFFFKHFKAYVCLSFVVCT